MKHHLSFLLLLWFTLFTLDGAIPPPGEQYDWRNAEHLFRGMELATLQLSGDEPLNICVVRLDLTEKALRFVTNNRAENWGEPMPDYPQAVIRTERITVRQFLENCRSRSSGALPVVLAINASPWRPWTKPFTHRYAAHMGLMISNGIEVAPPEANRPSLTIDKNNQLDFQTFQAGDDYSHLTLALSGFVTILEDGKNCAGSATDRHPRTVYGLSADRTKLFLMTIDGRQKGFSIGTTNAESAEWIRFFGADDAVNMDGGGSTTLIKFDPFSGTTQLLNSPSNGGERIVANALGIYYAED